MEKNSLKVDIAFSDGILTYECVSIWIPNEPTAPPNIYAQLRLAPTKSMPIYTYETIYRKPSSITVNPITQIRDDPEPPKEEPHLWVKNNPLLEMYNNNAELFGTLIDELSRKFEVGNNFTYFSKSEVMPIVKLAKQLVSISKNYIFILAALMKENEDERSRAK